MQNNRTPGRYGVSDLWYKDDGTPTALAEPDSNPQKPAGKGTRWRAYYIDAEGKQRTKQFKQKKLGEKWASTEGGKVQSGQWVDPKLAATPFREVAEAWFATKHQREEMTKYGYRNMLDQIILPEFGDRAIQNIKHEELQVFINSLSDEVNRHRMQGEGAFSPSRVRQIHLVIVGCMKYALRTDRIVKNPCDGIVLPEKRSGRQRYFTHEQLQALAKEMGRLEAITLLMGYCGLRESEAFALKRHALNGRRLEIFEAVTHVPKKGRVEKGTKTHRTRYVPIPDIVWEKMVIPIDPDALLFPGWGGRWDDKGQTALTPNQYRYHWNKAMAKLKFDGGHTPHDLRHTCASLAISAGANVKALQNLLGHASATMTLDQYGHLLSDDLEKVSTALNDAAMAVKLSA